MLLFQINMFLWNEQWKNMDTLQQDQWRAISMVGSWYKDRVRNLNLFYLQEEGSLEHHTEVFSYLMEEYWEDGVTLFSEVHSNQRQQTQAQTCKTSIKD